MGTGVNVTAGSVVGGLVDGQSLRCVDDTRAFNPSTAISGDWIDLGADNGLVTGDKITYRKGANSNTAVGGLTSNTTYQVEVSSTNPNLVRLWADTDDNETYETAVTLSGGATGTGTVRYR